MVVSENAASKVASHTLSSMTGFARAEGQFGAISWAWEIRSVNARGLELRCRLPQGFDNIEPVIRKMLTSALTRGTVYATLQINTSREASGLHVNEEALRSVLAAIKALRAENPDFPVPQPEAILGIRGVMENVDVLPSEEAHEALQSAMVAHFEKALEQLVSARREEGHSLSQVLQSQLSNIAGQVKQARGRASATSQLLQERLSNQLEQLLGDHEIAEDRLAQEVALLVVKADMTEELDRLDTHLQAAQDMLAQGGAIGRRFDFLVQEFNREANTLCAKAPDMVLKQIGLDLKTIIDQMREQIQNME